MQVDTVIVTHGNYVYSNNTAYVTAIGPSMGYSQVQIKYTQTWTNTTTTDTIVLKPACELTGTTAGPSCSSGCECYTGYYGKSSSGTGYDVTYSFPDLGAASPTSTIAYLTMGAFSYGLTGNTTQSDATGWFTH